MNFLMDVAPTFKQRFNSWVLQRSLHLLNFHSFKNILGYIFQHAAWHNTEFKWNTVFKMNEQSAYCHYRDPFHFFSHSHLNDLYWQWAWLWWLKAALFLFSLTTWNRGNEALSTPRGTSSLHWSGTVHCTTSTFCTEVEICWHLQHTGTRRNGGRQAHTAVLEPPQSRCTQVDGAVAMTQTLPFCPTMYICGFCRAPAQCRWLWLLPRVPKDLGSQ